VKLLLLPALAVLAVFAAALTALFRWSLLEFVPGSLAPGAYTLANFKAVVAPQYLHAVWDTLILAALTTAWRDIAHLTEVGLVLVFWLTPIVYPVEMVPGFWRSALTLSPPAAFAAAYQDVLFWGRLPAWTTAASTLTSAMAAMARYMWRSRSQRTNSIVGRRISLRAELPSKDAMTGNVAGAAFISVILMGIY